MSNIRQKLTYYPNGKIRTEKYYKGKLLHLEGEPAYRLWHKDGHLIREEYYFNGVRHNEDGPAALSYDRDGNLTKVSFYSNHQLSNVIGPAIQMYYKNGSPREEKYYRFGQLYSTGPSIRKWYSNGQIKCEKYLYTKEESFFSDYCNKFYTNSYNRYHNTEGPAHQEWHEDGSPKKIVYYVNGQLHREEEPVRQEWHKNGTVKTIIYAQNDRMHHTTMPARQEWFDDNHPKIERWMQHGNLYRLYNMPALIYWHKNHQLKCIAYYTGTYRMHCEDGPAFQQWYSDGTPKEVIYKIRGMYHRVGGPAIQKWYKNKKIEMVAWYKNWHTSPETNIPYQHWNKDGNLIHIEELNGRTKIITAWHDNLMLKQKNYYKIINGHCCCEDLTNCNHRIDYIFHNEDGPAIQQWDEDGNLVKVEWMRDGKKYESMTKACKIAI